MLWENLREEEFDAAIERSGGLCVLPIGCIEKHGEHLPVGTDSLVCESLVRDAAERSDVVVFPSAKWLGDVSCYHAVERPEASDNLGFIGISPETLMLVLGELCDEIARNGFTKILIVNGHGGNDPWLDFFTRAQFYKKKSYVTMWTFAYNYNALKPAGVTEGGKLITNFTAVATCINNVGPGLDLVGPYGGFGFFSPLSKLVLSFAMLAGRLELFPMLILFAPSSWKRK